MLNLGLKPAWVMGILSCISGWSLLARILSRILTIVGSGRLVCNSQVSSCLSPFWRTSVQRLASIFLEYVPI